MGPPRQLTLFGDNPLLRPAIAVLPEEMTWSYSRRSRLEQCARRYYDEYYGANRRTARDEPLKEHLHSLKALASRHARAGTLLHLAIKRYLLAGQRGEPCTMDGLISWVRRLFRADQDFSCAYPAVNDRGIDGQYPPVLLREYVYHEPEAEALCAEMERRLVDALRRFANDRQYASFRLAGSRPGALLEHAFSLAGFPCRVEGKVDLAYAHDGDPTVVDWKLGEEDGTGDDSLQLAVYAMWAGQYYGCAPEDVRVCRVHFGSGSAVEFSIDARVVAAARARILQDVERMAALHEYGQRAVADAFTPCWQPAVCRTCPFAMICYPNEEPHHA